MPLPFFSPQFINLMQAQTPSLAEIAAAQAAHAVFAYDRGNEQRRLARLQRIYAAKLAQLENFYTFFDEGQPDVVLRGATGELALRLPACNQMSEIYSGLRDALDNELRDLERQIVAAHIDIERDRRETEQYGYTEPSYAPAIRALCVPTGPAVAPLMSSRAISAEPLTAHAA